MVLPANLDLVRTVLPADPLLTAGIALVVGLIVGHFAGSVYTWVKAFVVGMAVRHLILVVLATSGVGIETLVPGGLVGFLRGLLEGIVPLFVGHVAVVTEVIIW